MNLLLQPGRLVLQSTQADINNAVNLGQLEAPGVLLQDVSGRDFVISALFLNVQVPNGSDQLMLYAGTSAGSLIRAGFHQQNVYLFSENQGQGDQNTLLSPFNAFDTGDDVILTLSRANGLWRLSWENLTTPSNSGAGPGFALPWLDAAPDLYVGVIASNAGTPISFPAEIEWFAVSTVPEPASLTLWAMAAVGLAALAYRRSRLPTTPTM
jgi:hypothetical protein